MFSEHRFSSTFQSAEALAHACSYSGRELSKADHKGRVNALVSAAQRSGVDREIVAWAQRILQSRNETQIRDLVQSTGLIGENVLASSPIFGQIVYTIAHGEVISHRFEIDL